MRKIEEGTLPSGRFGNLALTPEGTVAGHSGITNREVGEQVGRLMEDSKGSQTQTRLGGMVIETRGEMKEETIAERLFEYLSGNESLQGALEGTRLAILGGRTAVAENRRGASYAHYGESHGSTVFLGENLLAHLLENDPESLETLLSIEMNRKEYRKTNEEDARSSLEVVRSAGIGRGALERLLGSIAQVEAESILTARGGQEVAEAIIAASDALEEKAGREAQVDQVLLGKLKGRVLDAVVEGLAERIRQKDLGKVEKAVKRVEERREEEAERILAEALMDAVQEVGDEGAAVEAVGLNLFMEEVVLYTGKGTSRSVELSPEAMQVLSRLVGRKAGDLELVVIDLVRGLDPKSSLEEHLSRGIGALLGEGPMAEGEWVPKGAVSLEHMELGGTELIYVSRGEGAIVQLQEGAENLLSTMGFFLEAAEASEKSYPVAVNAALLEAMDFAPIASHAGRIAISEEELKNLSSEKQQELLPFLDRFQENWETFTSMSPTEAAEHQMAVVLQEEDVPLPEELQRKTVSLLPMKPGQTGNAAYALLLAGYVAAIGKEQARQDEEANEMLRALLLQIFNELIETGQILEEDLEAVSFEKILEDPSNFLLPPIKTRQLEDVESFIRAKEIIDVMA